MCAGQPLAHRMSALTAAHARLTDIGCQCNPRLHTFEASQRSMRFRLILCMPMHNCLLLVFMKICRQHVSAINELYDTLSRVGQQAAGSLYAHSRNDNWPTSTGQQHPQMSTRQSLSATIVKCCRQLGGAAALVGRDCTLPGPMKQQQWNAS